MSDYGVFEASSTDGHEEEQRQRQATRDLGRAIESAREGFGDFLGAATDKQDYQDRLALVMNDLMQKVADSGVMPVPGVMRKVKAALRPQFRESAGWSKGTSPDISDLSKEQLQEFIDNIQEAIDAGVNVGQINENKQDRFREELRSRSASRKQARTEDEIRKARDDLDKELTDALDEGGRGDEVKELRQKLRDIDDELSDSMRESSRKTAGDLDDFESWVSEEANSVYDSASASRYLSTFPSGEEPFDNDPDALLYAYENQFAEASRKQAAPGFDPNISDENLLGAIQIAEVLKRNVPGQEQDDKFDELLAEAERRGLDYFAWASKFSSQKQAGDAPMTAQILTKNGWETVPFYRFVQFEFDSGTVVVEVELNGRIQQIELPRKQFKMISQASRKQAHNYEAIADRAADDFERDTGNDPYTDPNFITQYLPAWASANAQDIAFDPALYEELEMEANMLGYGYTVEGKRKRAGVDSDVNSFVLYLQGIGYRMPKDAGYPGEGGELDDELYGYFKGDQSKIDEVTKFLQEKWDYYAYGIGASRKRSGIDHADRVYLRNPDGSIDRSSLGVVFEVTPGGMYGVEWRMSKGSDDGYDSDWENVEDYHSADELVNVREVDASRKQASDVNTEDQGVLQFFYQFEDEGLDVSASGDEQWEWLKSNIDYDTLQDAIDQADEYGEVSRSNIDSMAYELQQTFFGSRKQASAYLPVVSVEQDTGDSYMAELKGGFAFEAYDEGGTWVWNIFDDSGEEVASDETFSLDAAKDDAAYALERVASRKQAFSGQLGVHLTEVFESGEAGGGWRPITGERLDWMKGDLEFYGGSGIFNDWSLGEDGEQEVLSFDTSDDSVIIDAAWKAVDYANGIRASRKTSSNDALLLDAISDLMLNGSLSAEDQDAIERAYGQGEQGKWQAAYNSVTFVADGPDLGSWENGLVEAILDGIEDLVGDPSRKVDSRRKQAESYQFGGGWSAKVVYDSDDEGEYAEAILTGPGGVEETIYPGDGRRFEPGELEDEAQLMISEYGDDPYADTYQYNSSRRKQALELGEWEEDLPGLGYAKATKTPGGGWEVYIWDEAGQNETLTPVNSSEEARRLFQDTIKSYPGSGFDHIDF